MAALRAGGGVQTRGGQAGPLADFYGRLSRGKGKSTAKVAAARKLGTYVYYILRDGKDYGELVRFINDERG